MSLSAAQYCLNLQCVFIAYVYAELSHVLSLPPLQIGALGFWVISTVFVEDVLSSQHSAEAQTETSYERTK